MHNSINLGYLKHNTGLIDYAPGHNGWCMYWKITAHLLQPHSIHQPQLDRNSCGVPSQLHHYLSKLVNMLKLHHYLSKLVNMWYLPDIIVYGIHLNGCPSPLTLFWQSGWCTNPRSELIYSQCTQAGRFLSPWQGGISDLEADILLFKIMHTPKFWIYSTERISFFAKTFSRNMVESFSWSRSLNSGFFWACMSSSGVTFLWICDHFSRTNVWRLI